MLLLQRPAQPQAITRESATADMITVGSNLIIVLAYKTLQGDGCEVFWLVCVLKSGLMEKRCKWMLDQSQELWGKS